MKASLISLLLLAGCAHRPPVAVPAPSVSAVKASLSQAQAQLADLRGSTEAVYHRVSAARTRAQRIDDKATVLLEHWP